MFRSIFFLTILAFAALVHGAEHYFTFYSEPNYQGESYTATHSTGNVSSLSPIIKARKSYCVKGWWMMTAELNYNENDGVGSVWFSRSDQETCVPSITNHIYDRYNSLRIPGNPAGSEKAGLSLYTEHYFYGREFYVGPDADEPNVTIPVVSYGMSGKSTWTFYTEPNYGGFKYCVSSRGGPDGADVDLVFPTGTSSNIRSVRRGCHV